jgi:hypothetical protein
VRWQRCRNRAEKICISRSRSSTRSLRKSFEATTGNTESLAGSIASWNSGRPREGSGGESFLGDAEVPWSEFARLEERYSLPRARVVYGLRSSVAKS